MRMVQVTVTYDMDDPEKPLADELLDWLQGRIDVEDVQAMGGWLDIREMEHG